MTDDLEQTRTQLATMQTQWASEQQLSATLQAKVQELLTLLGEKQTQLQALSETSTHARESLLHYREAAKEQRDTLLRQHEQQVLHVEQQFRTQARTLDGKQDAIIGLNRNNKLITTHHFDEIIPDGPKTEILTSEILSDLYQTDLHV